MTKKVLMILTNHDTLNDGTPTGLWLGEAAEPYKVFERNNIEVDLASIKGGTVPIDPNSTQNDETKTFQDVVQKLGETLKLKDVVFENYDGVFIPGGHGTMYDLPGDADVQNILAFFKDDNRVIGAVCHGPSAFVGAKLKSGNYLIDGVKLTGFTNEEETQMKLDQNVPFALQTELEQNGARFVKGKAFESNVVSDGKFVTGQNPQSSTDVAEAFVKVL
ncbi:type 1 glutamine amidotransferase domain-containing protein [Macrococcus armenti]|uniref:Type 1 glutamine amidotransferase domain-containing protein n=1 Tax=Macrococcus armenti TaxID=2875764 RepID=A0ABY3ZRR5_9STAP|nr:type 1 glutamine amidotransferase domain-containing protein [Macrococcus armenti]UOB19581.1 type 1 glutamine amidotransferase domain-containing protein [Macrococcus armenti]